ncbi:MAG: DUF4834 family protein [Bacteroidales bacterium]
MEFILTFLLILIGASWVFGKIFPRILAWYVKRKLKQMGNSGGGGFAGFGPGGFATGGFGPGSQGGFDAEAAKRAAQEQVRKEKEQEGRVTVIQTAEQEKVIERSMGEYVEFEEEKSDTKE